MAEQRRPAGRGSWSKGSCVSACSPAPGLRIFTMVMAHHDNEKIQSSSFVPAETVSLDLFIGYLVFICG